MVEAASRDEAVEVGTAAFRAAAARAGLPPWPVGLVEAVGERDELETEQGGRASFR